MPVNFPPFWIIAVFLFLFGAVIGSFLNVCIHRIPAKEGFWDSLKGLWSPPSRCPYCFRLIPKADNIPVFGWIKIRGRCRFCKARISPRYPLIELLNGILFVLLYWFEIPQTASAFVNWPLPLSQSPLFVPTYWTAAFPPSSLDGVWLLHLRYLYHLVLVEALIVATFIDFDLRIIPDGATLPAMAVGVLGGWLVPQLHLVPVWFQCPLMLGTFRPLFPEGMWPLLSVRVPGWLAQFPHLHGLAISVAGLLVGGGVVWIVRIIGHWVLRREAMGFGDVVLMAMIGSFLGWQAAVTIFFIAPACALLVVALCWIVRRDREIPYGPYISLATLLMLFAWPKLWTAAERIFCLGPVVILMGLAMSVMLVATLYAMQGVKRLLGIPLHEESWLAEWTSADQLAHFAGEHVDEQQGGWRHEVWQGQLSGRGLSHYETWRRGSRDRR